MLKRASDVARLRGKNVNDLVSKSVAQATMDAENEDAAHGIASVVGDQTVEAPQPTAAPVAAETATPTPVEAADVSQTESTSTAQPTTEGGV